MWQNCSAILHRGKRGIATHSSQIDVSFRPYIVLLCPLERPFWCKGERAGIPLIRFEDLRGSAQRIPIWPSSTKYLTQAESFLGYSSPYRRLAAYPSQEFIGRDAGKRRQGNRFTNEELGGQIEGFDRASTVKPKWAVQTCTNYVLVPKGSICM